LLNRSRLVIEHDFSWREYRCLRIKPNFNPTECRIWAEDKLVRKPNENNIWEFKMEGVKEMVPINYHITI
jgi:hypothetical protein